MTITGLVLFFVTAAFIAGTGVCIAVMCSGISSKILALVVSTGLIAAVFFGMSWYFNHTESGKRALKTQESNLEGGINRSVKVYDAVGNVLQEYTGRFDVDFDGDEQRILFDDENGMRHVIYFKTGTVVVEEI